MPSKVNSPRSLMYTEIAEKAPEQKYSISHPYKKWHNLLGSRKFKALLNVAGATVLPTTHMHLSKSAQQVQREQNLLEWEHAAVQCSHFRTFQNTLLKCHSVVCFADAPVMMPNRKRLVGSHFFLFLFFRRAVGRHVFASVSQCKICAPKAHTLMRQQ